MNLFSRKFAALLLMFVSQVYITLPMERPEKEVMPKGFFTNSPEGRLMNQFLTAEINKDSNIYLAASNDDLETVILLSKKSLDNSRYFQSLYDSMQFFKQKINVKEVKRLLMRIIEQAEVTLAKRKSLLIEKGFGEEKPVNEQVKIRPVSEPAKINVPVKESQQKLVTLKRFLKAEQNNDMEFYKTRSNYSLESVIPFAVSVMNNKNDVKTLSKELKISDGELIKLLTNVIQNANYYSKPVEMPVEKPAKPIARVEHLVPVSQEISQRNFIFSNQTSNKLVTLWVSSGYNMWGQIKLLPLEDSPEVNPAKDTMIHIYVGSDDYILIPKHDSIILAKEVVSDRYMGRSTNKFVDLREIKTFKVTAKAKLLVIINPNLSINVIERS